ncbi:MAG: uncharacterized protein A8A55_1073, partial [Amphiamblys sp. WSBS2006]
MPGRTNSFDNANTAHSPSAESCASTYTWALGSQQARQGSQQEYCPSASILISGVGSESLLQIERPSTRHIHNGAAETKRSDGEDEGPRQLSGVAEELTPELEQWVAEIEAGYPEDRAV